MALALKKENEYLSIEINQRKGFLLLGVLRVVRVDLEENSEIDEDLEGAADDKLSCVCVSVC